MLRDGRIHHYNGKRWKLWNTYANNYWWEGAKVSEKFVIGTGRNIKTDKAVILKGSRK